MNDKKIYQLLQEWYPELQSLKLPKKKFRRDFNRFCEWLSPKRIDETADGEDVQKYKYRGYFLTIDRDQHFENGVETCALFQDFNADVDEIQNRIEERTEPLFKHFEKYKDLIGNFYALRSHVYDVVLEEIYNEVRKHGHRMLLIYAAEQAWMAVPDDAKQIDKFIKLFRKQFIGSYPTTEFYERFKPFNLSTFLYDD